jgi:paraquat-inducible protein A
MQSIPLTICPHCDAVYHRPRVAIGELASCARCNEPLYRDYHFNVHVMLALTLAALIVFVIANVFPVATIHLQGMSNSSTLWDMITVDFRSGISPISLVAALALFFLPLTQLLLLLHILLPLRLGHLPWRFQDVMHLLRLMRPWSMTDVFLLGTIVAVVKIAAMTDVEFGIGIWAWGALVCLLTALMSFNLHALWEFAENVEA